MPDVIIQAEQVRKLYRMPAEEIHAVDGVDLSVRQGAFIALMGPSGSGKTTLLDVLGCLTSITDGRLTLFGRDVSRAGEAELVAVRRQHLGFVFQDFLLIPSLTALENVEAPLIFARKPVDRDRPRALLERVGLGGRAGHLPRQLSGGEKQRVAIARALATAPGVLIADEPTGNLDSRNAQEIAALLAELNRVDGLTILMATHDEKLGGHADRVLRMRDGKLAG